LFVLDPAGDAATAAETSMQLELLAEAVASLPPRCREIFLLCHVEGAGQAEVARRLGLSSNTVAVQSARGLHRCDEFIRRRLAQP
jgi:RNA polymerase sigma-70 factor (ECF subfamily)